MSKELFSERLATHFVMEIKNSCKMYVSLKSYALHNILSSSYYIVLYEDLFYLKMKFTFLILVFVSF